MTIYQLDIGDAVRMREAFFSTLGIGTIIERTDEPTTTIEFHGETMKYYGYRVQWENGEGTSPWLSGADLVYVAPEVR